MPNAPPSSRPLRLCNLHSVALAYPSSPFLLRAVFVPPRPLGSCSTVPRPSKTVRRAISHALRKPASVASVVHALKAPSRAHLDEAGDCPRPPPSSFGALKPASLRVIEALSHLHQLSHYTPCQSSVFLTRSRGTAQAKDRAHDGSGCGQGRRAQTRRCCAGRRGQGAAQGGGGALHGQPCRTFYGGEAARRGRGRTLRHSRGEAYSVAQCLRRKGTEQEQLRLLRRPSSALPPPPASHTPRLVSRLVSSILSTLSAPPPPRLSGLCWCARSVCTRVQARHRCLRRAEGEPDQPGDGGQGAAGGAARRGVVPARFPPAGARLQVPLARARPPRPQRCASRQRTEEALAARRHEQGRREPGERAARCQGEGGEGTPYNGTRLPMRPTPASRGRCLPHPLVPASSLPPPSLSLPPPSLPPFRPPPSPLPPPFPSPSPPHLCPRSFLPTPFLLCTS